MARDMGGGMKVYLMGPGRPAGPEDLVETLGDQIATVDQQRAAAEERWPKLRPK
jgi:hypothetical protein